MTRRFGSIYPVLAILGAAFALSFPVTRLVLAVNAGAQPGGLAGGGIYLLAAVVLAVVACMTLIGGRYAGLCFALYLFALSRAAQPASGWVQLLPEDWKWLGGLMAALVAGSSIYGYVTLCVRMPTGEAMERWRGVDRLLPAYAVLVGLVYAAGLLHWGPFAGRNVFSVLLWIGYLVGAIAYLDRRRTVSGEERLRTRWVALAITAHVVIEAVMHLLFAAKVQPASFLFILDPAPYAFAYALLRGRIIDVRVFGGRALVYAMLTSLPLAAFTTIEWFFGQELQNARLANTLVIAIAVGFSFWLQSLHRRIDRFVERVMFARRHRAHRAIEQMIAALPFVERTETLRTLLVDDVREQLDFRSAALYANTGQCFELRASAGCDGLPHRLDADDPLLLYPRSQRLLVSLREMPTSRPSIAAGDTAPAYALPIVGGNNTYAVVLYGEHRSGETIDAEEEKLLLRLAHGTANTYEHLLLMQRDREIAALRAQLEHAVPVG